MEKKLTKRESKRATVKELVVPIAIDAGLFAIESFVMQAMIPGFVAVNHESLQTRRGKLKFFGGCIAAYPALVAINYKLGESLSDTMNEAVDELLDNADRKKIRVLREKGFTLNEIAKAMDLDPARIWRLAAEEVSVSTELAKDPTEA